MTKKQEKRCQMLINLILNQKVGWYQIFYKYRRANYRETLQNYRKCVFASNVGLQIQFAQYMRSYKLIVISVKQMF